MELTQIILGLVSFAVYISTVHSIKCFQCNSVRDADCDKLVDLTSSNPYFLECNETYHGHKAFCRKTTHTIVDGGSMRTVRACGWELYKNNHTNCYERDSDFKLERSCQCFLDGCNSAWRYGPTMMLPSIGVGLTLLSAIYQLC